MTEHRYTHHCRRIGIFYYHDMIKWKKQIEVIMWYRLLNLHVKTLHVGWPQCVNDFHWLFRVHLFFIPVVFIQFVRVSTILHSFCHRARTICWFLQFTVNRRSIVPTSRLKLIISHPLSVPVSIESETFEIFDFIKSTSGPP